MTGKAARTGVVSMAMAALEQNLAPRERIVSDALAVALRPPLARSVIGNVGAGATRKMAAWAERRYPGL